MNERRINSEQENQGTEKKIVRKSVALLVMRIITIELLLTAGYILLRIILNQVNQTTLLSTDLPATPIGIAWIFMMSIIQSSVIIALSLKWMSEFYELRDTEIIYHSGIIEKVEKEYSLQGVQSISIKEDLLGRLFKYGTIKIFSPALQQELVFTEVSHPEDFAKNIKSILGENKLGLILRRR